MCWSSFLLIYLFSNDRLSLAVMAAAFIYCSLWISSCKFHVLYYAAVVFDLGPWTVITMWNTINALTGIHFRCLHVCVVLCRGDLIFYKYQCLSDSSHVEVSYHLILAWELWHIFNLNFNSHLTAIILGSWDSGIDCHCCLVVSWRFRSY